MIIAGTGHRPDKLGGYNERTSRKLKRIAYDFLASEKVSFVITGMAQGWDQALAEAAYALEIPYHAYIPFRGQEYMWPDMAQEKYKEILKHAFNITTCSAGEFSAKAMQKRNEMMVDDADLILAMWDGSTGGTFNCIKYAEKVGKPIINLYDRL